MKHYSQVFKPTEVLMMLSAFSNIETIHIAAYSHLLDTIGMPEIEYQAFLRYKEMKDKYDYMQSFRVDSKHEIAKTLAAFGAFTEGLQLFASFAILLNFPRFNKLKGMGQIISWSVRDETLHCLSVIRLFRTFVAGKPGNLDGGTQARALPHLRHHRRPRGRLHRPGLRAGRGGRARCARRSSAISATSPTGGWCSSASTRSTTWRQPAALAGRHAERGRAHQFLREPRDRIQQGLHHRHLGRGLRRCRPGSGLD